MSIEAHPLSGPIVDPTINRKAEGQAWRELNGPRKPAPPATPSTSPPRVALTMSTLLTSMHVPASYTIDLCAKIVSEASSPVVSKPELERLRAGEQQFMALTKSLNSWTPSAAEAYLRGTISRLRTAAKSDASLQSEVVKSREEVFAEFEAKGLAVRQERKALVESLKPLLSEIMRRFSVACEAKAVALDAQYAKLCTDHGLTPETLPLSAFIRRVAKQRVASVANIGQGTSPANILMGIVDLR